MNEPQLNKSLNERAVEAQERQAAALEDIAGELRRLTAAVLSTPIAPGPAGTFHAGLVVRTTDGFRQLGNWELADAPHRPDCECSRCRQEGDSE